MNQRLKKRSHPTVQSHAEPEHDASDFTQGWTTSRLDAIAEINPRHSNKLDESQLVTFLPMPAISESSPDFDPSAERPLADVRKGYTHFADGDVLFAKITPCMENGKGAVATGLKNGLGCGSTELHVIRPLGAVDAHYVYRFLQQESVRQDAAEKFTGSAGQLRVPSSFIAELELPLPPLAEQRRIVAKLEELLGKVSSSQQRLSRIPSLLKRFRQSVLAAACSARLTADWREENSTEVASVPAESGKRPLPPIADDEQLFEAPPTWQWCRLGTLAAFINGDRGKNYPNKSEYVPEGMAFINTGHIRPDGSLSSETMHFLTRGKFDSLGSGKIKRGDLVYCLRGATLGKTAFVEPYEEGAIASSLVIIRLNAFADRKFAYYVLTSPYGKELVGRFDNGSAQPNLSADSVKNYTFPLPSLSEQQEIVRRVEKLFAFADQIEARLKLAQSHVDRLTQSLLRKAFRGELVPTEHALATAAGRDYESAFVLLDRIQSERSLSQPVGRQRTKPAGTR